LFSLRAFALTLTSMSLLFVPAAAMAQDPAANPAGGAEFPPPPPPVVNLTTPGALAKLMPDGTAAAPADAPPQVQQAVWAANLIQDKPYIYGGGHKDFQDDGYDCSGTVSYMLHGGALLDTPLDSSSFMKWGDAGPGTWITVYTNPGHAFAVIAGLRLDTSAAGVTTRATKAAGYKKALERGPRWRPSLRSTRGYKKRHPVGF
jgi:cell wall-associated NlpC family hydrolase